MKNREPAGISVSVLSVLTVNKESSSRAVAMGTVSVMACGADKLIVCFFSPVHSHLPLSSCLHLSSFSLSSVFSLPLYWRHECSVLSSLQSYIFLSEVDEVLQVNVISVGSYVVVDEKVELIFNPVFKDKGQDTGGQLQEEDYPQKHRKLGEKRDKYTLLQSLTLILPLNLIHCSSSFLL